MLRYYQSYLSVKGALYVHIVQRKLAVARPVVQLRLSVLATTVFACLVAVIMAATRYFAEPRDHGKKHLQLPGSQFEWMAQAAQQNFPPSQPTRSATVYAEQREDLVYATYEITAGHTGARILATYISQCVPSSSKDDVEKGPPHTNP